MNNKITIEKIVYPGKSLGRGEDGTAVFIEGALPEETAEIVILKNRKTFKEGKLLQITQPSSKRIEPSCNLFGKCGGCSFQHTDYTNQIKIKEEYSNELLSQSGIKIDNITSSPLLFGYRNKMEFSFFYEDDKIKIGLHEKKQFNKYVEISSCLICDKDFLPVIKIIQDFANYSSLLPYNKKTHEGFYRHLVIRKAVKTNQILINLVTNKNPNINAAFFKPLADKLKSNVHSFYWTINSSFSDAVNADELILVDGIEMIEEHLFINNKTYTFAISPFSFFQTNTYGTEKLYKTVIDFLNGSEDDVLLDLYCGTGTIGIIAAPYVKQVFGVEQIPSAIENANYNKEKNNIKNITFSVGTVEKWSKNFEILFNKIIIDPPRGGLSGKVIDFILKNSPEKIIYVSCNPSTLARDLKDFTEKGPYKIDAVEAIDMFPQTYHIELVVSLSR